MKNKLRRLFRIRHRNFIEPKQPIDWQHWHYRVTPVALVLITVLTLAIGIIVLCR